MKNICARGLTIKWLTVLTAALVIVLAGVLVLSFYGVPCIVDLKVASSVRLENDTEQWDRFLDLPIPVITNVYLFTVTNSEDVLKGALPVVQEVGPYVYRQNLTRRILSTDSSEDSVTYEKHTAITFDQELSGDHTEDDMVTVINPALLVLTQITSSVEQLVVTGCLEKIFPPEYVKLFIHSDVRTLMFEGFPFANMTEEMGYACNIVRNQVIQKTKVMKNVEYIYNEEFPEVVQMLKFSYLGFKTQHPDGVYTVNRGIDDISKLGTIMRWNYSPFTPYYGRMESLNNDTCKRVRGGDSMIYPPSVSKDSSFEIFSTDICRTVKLSYAGEGTYEGIKGYRFEPSEDTFYPVTPNVENDCYCTKRTLNPKGEPSCYLDGIVDVMDCFGAPLLLSFPHFLYAEKYLNGVRNLAAPNKSIHEIYLLLEPNTGIPLQGKKRVQLNVVLRPISHMPFAANLPETVLPLLWIDEGAELTQDLIDMLNDQFFDIVKIANGVKFTLIAISAAAVLVAGGILIRKKYIHW